MKVKSNYFFILILLILLILIIINPKLNLDNFYYGIKVWGQSVLPALLPFFFITKLLNDLGFSLFIGKYLSPITQKLFHTSGVSGYIYAMSILSGYPVGAKLTSDFYEKGIIDSNEAVRITAFTSTSGPLFIIGTVGVGMFYSTKLGIILLISHYISAIANGLLYRNYKYSKKNCKTFNINVEENILENAMLSSIKSILIIGGYIALFFMIICLLQNYNILSPINYLLCKIFPKLDSNIFNSICSGVIEITKGSLDISKLGLSFKENAYILSGIIGFGGLSVHMQSYTFIKKTGIPFKIYLLQKLTQSCFAVLITIILLLFT